MAGGGAKNRNHWINEEEQEKHGGGSLNNSCGGDDHGYYDPPTSCNNAVVLVSAFGHESFHHQPPWNQVNLNPKENQPKMRPEEFYSQPSSKKLKATNFAAICLQIGSWNERGPIGLTLRRSPSLINQILRLAQQKRKVKAVNMPAVFLRIGSWKWASRNEGDLVVKFYYGRKKLVWEFLSGSLKKKIEIQWSQVSAINALVDEDKKGRLQIELNEQPEYGQEVKFQAGKHTQWATTDDFTGGQAPICRRHTVVFSPGVLDEPFKKLLQCDDRLLNLSRQPFPTHNSPLFRNRSLDFSYNRSVHECPSVPISSYDHQGPSPSVPISSYGHQETLPLVPISNYDHQGPSPSLPISSYDHQGTYPLVLPISSYHHQGTYPSVPISNYDHQETSPASVPISVYDHQRTSPASVPISNYGHQGTFPSVPISSYDHQGPSPASVPISSYGHQGTSPASVPISDYGHQGTSPALVPISDYDHQGTSSALVPISDYDHQGTSFLPYVQNLGHSSSNLPMPDLKFPNSDEVARRVKQRTDIGVLEQSGNSRVQDISFTPFGEQDHDLLPYNGVESWIQDQQLELHLTDDRQSCFTVDSTCKPFKHKYYQNEFESGGNSMNRLAYVDDDVDQSHVNSGLAFEKQNSGLPIEAQARIDGSSSGGSHMTYLDDEIFNLDEYSWLNDGLAFEEPSSWSPSQFSMHGNGIYTKW